MIGHQKTNKKLCPAYIEEKTENIGQIDEKIEVLKAEINEERGKMVQERSDMIDG